MYFGTSVLTSVWTDSEGLRREVKRKANIYGHRNNSADNLLDLQQQLETAQSEHAVNIQNLQERLAQLQETGKERESELTRLYEARVADLQQQLAESLARGITLLGMGYSVPCSIVR